MRKLYVFIIIILCAVAIAVPLILWLRKEANKPPCVNKCSIGDCGNPDGCGGICGCPKGTKCWKGKCCESKCPPGTCGVPDGCGGVCGCPSGETCFHKKCCKPQCTKNTCDVSDQCGGVCKCPEGVKCKNIGAKGQCCDNLGECCTFDKDGNKICQIEVCHGKCSMNNRILCNMGQTYGGYIPGFFKMGNTCNNCVLINPKWDNPDTTIPSFGTVRCETCANGPTGGPCPCPESCIKSGGCTPNRKYDSGCRSNQAPTPNEVTFSEDHYGIDNSNGTLSLITTPPTGLTMCDTVADCERMGIKGATCGECKLFSPAGNVCITDEFKQTCAL
jgi:hypothetical protein